MASRKKNNKYLKKKRSHKRRSMKRKMRGGCGFSSNQPSFLMRGGGDYFSPNQAEPPSFTNVPIHSFYANNTYEKGTDIQGGQMSSRLVPNIYGGGKKSKKVRFSKTMNKRNKKRVSKKMKGGMSFSYPFIGSFSDPALTNNAISMNPVSTFSGVSGAFLGSNIVAGYQQDNYSPSPISAIPLPSPLV